MTCYIANHEKVQRLFAKRERELRHAIHHTSDEAKIVRAAERLREARLKIFKSEFSRRSVLPARYWEPDEAARGWQDRPVEEIVEEYRKAGA